ncbi:hypothetical protein NQ314_021344 [Rhamnusium bicolor]|uniref:Spindle assembly abnormal protein 6 N-terminal domain-containing protein n=1 Tax=Rhamnusium bicolor TaxID=1586634 RepID=A0AAV8WHZ0_9CUCU|nr:hypothetical protein NQ314_021344 [Rhamnusium bicolor]
MSTKEPACLYDKSHTITIYDNGQMEERNLNITIINLQDSLQIKLRDPLDFCFNYTENIDLGDFEIMRVNQSLDINFNEFKCNLIEMLQQFHKKRNGTNDRLKKQLSNIRKTVIEKDQQIQQLNILKNQLEVQFHNNLKQLDDLFNVKIKQVENMLINKIILNKQRLLKLLKEVEILKREMVLKSDSSTRLLKSMEDLRLEAVDNAAVINQLKKENSALHATKLGQEKNLIDLRKSLQDKEVAFGGLQKKNDELRADVEKAAIVLSQKKSTIDELSKDLVQANQMLVNFNNHYEIRAKQVEELQKTLATQDRSIKEQKIRTNDIVREFEEYKAMFSSEQQDKLKHELFMANNKIQELEKSIRKANKINTLLTEKVNNQNLGFNNN